MPYNEAKDEQINRRLLYFTRGLAFWLALIAIKLVYLQVICHDELARQASQQQFKKIELQARRGAIYDRSGEVLAMSLPATSISVNPLKIKNAEFAASLLAGILSIDRADLLSKMHEAEAGRRGFLWVKRNLSEKEIDALKPFKLDWVEWQTESQRFYPNNELAAHILGGVHSDQTGSSGIEQSLNDDLSGLPGVEQRLTDVLNRSIYSQVVADPRPGADVWLTINREIQHVAERELKEVVENNRVQQGTITVMRPDGEVLAMSSYPSYDPNKPVAPNESDLARNNLTITTPFEPGSVFKVITLSAAIDSARVRPDTMINCGNGAFSFFGRVVHDTHSNGVQPVSGVLIHSSNIGAIQIGLRMGEEKLLEYVRRFGFGKPTGIALPGESGGKVRRLKDWTKTSIASVAMGQEVSATSLQLARACAVVANGGMLVTPRLILKKQRVGSGPEMPADDQLVRVISPETAIKMRRMMEGVILEGTGKSARLKGYTAGGKTGTAQIFDSKRGVYTHTYNASFIGFAPLANPAIVIAVTFSPSTAMGGTIAGPVFQKVATEALRILDVPRDLPEDFTPPPHDKEEDDDLSLAGLDLTDPGSTEAGDGSPSSALVRVAGSPDQRRSFSMAVQITGPKTPNLIGKSIRAVLQESSAQGFAVELYGAGLARAQVPAPGEPLAPGERIRVRFAR